MNVEQIVRAKEDQIRFQTFESAFAWDAQGNEILAKEGHRSGVSMTPQECALLSDTVFTHNHPDGLRYNDSDPRYEGNSFSDVDVEFAMTNSLAEIRAVTPKLRFSLKRPAVGWSGADWISIAKPEFEYALNEVRAEQTGAFRRGAITSEQAQANHWHKIWLRVSQRLGWDYRREES